MCYLLESAPLTGVPDHTNILFENPQKQIKHSDSNASDDRQYIAISPLHILIKVFSLEKTD